ncbi:hypothetical protein SHKM778_24560 [Streptomyces sp. KM77-8]|uniref:Uncharacterized protein n=1 Tax=Streptomyces haneummycinicus TaxID=3074435 RepID=A0AAT9HF09_9ACTN
MPLGGRPDSPLMEVKYEGRDVPGIVLTPVVTAFETPPDDPQRLCHARTFTQAVGFAEDGLGVDVVTAEG